MDIAEAWFCAQWLIFVLFLRFVFGFLYGWKIQTWPIIRFLQSLSLIDFLSVVFDRIHDAMCLNKMSRTSRNIDPQHQKYSSIFHCTWRTFYPCVHQTHVCCEKANLLVTPDHRSQSHLKVQSCLATDYAGDSFLVKVFSILDLISFIFYFIEALPNSMWWWRCCLIIFFNGFLTWNSSFFCHYPAFVLRVFSHSNSPSHRALGRYRHTSSSRQFRNIFCWLEILNYCPDGGNGNLHCSSSFLKAPF